MNYQVLARKYRPQKFSDVIGQGHVTRTLKSAIEQQRIAHGYIFSGHRGIGKTTVARILAMALNCRSAQQPVAEPCGVCDSCTEIRASGSVDVIEIDAASNRGIDEIRELREAARYRPARDRYKIYILDEAHQITDAAFNALLKTLEEPPGHVIFMMATTQPEDIPQTIRSRCQHFSFHAVRFDEIVAQLRQIAGREGIQADENALAVLAEAGDGSMRDALSIMDQAIACCGDKLSAETVLQLVGAVPSESLEQMMQAVQRGSSEEVLRLVDKLITEGQNAVHFARQMVHFLRNTVVAKVAGSDSALLQISADERARVARVAELFGEEDLARFLAILLRTHSELGYKQEQRFHLELGLLKVVHAERLLPLEELLSGAALSSQAGGKAATDGGQSTSAVAAVRASSTSAEPSHRTPAAEGNVAGRPSPFEADRARKSGGQEPEMQINTAIAEVETGSRSGSESELKSSVLNALETGNFRMLASMLEEGNWKLQGNELIVEIAASASVVEMAMGADAKRVANSAASTAAGRSLKVRASSAAAATAGGSGGSNNPGAVAAGGGSSGRSRATDDPVVKRMQEKFGAEIRTVIDHRQKR